MCHCTKWINTCYAPVSSGLPGLLHGPNKVYHEPCSLSSTPSPNTCTHTLTLTHALTHDTHTHISSAYSHSHIHSCTHALTHAHTHSHMHTHTCTLTHAHSHMHSHSHMTLTHTHTHTHSSLHWAYRETIARGYKSGTQVGTSIPHPLLHSQGSRDTGDHTQLAQ